VDTSRPSPRTKWARASLLLTRAGSTRGEASQRAADVRVCAFHGDHTAAGVLERCETIRSDSVHVSSQPPARYATRRAYRRPGRARSLLALVRLVWPPCALNVHHREGLALCHDAARSRRRARNFKHPLHPRQSLAAPAGTVQRGARARPGN
jgi:hypothetical protein